MGQIKFLEMMSAMTLITGVIGIVGGMLLNDIFTPIAGLGLIIGSYAIYKSERKYDKT